MIKFLLLLLFSLNCFADQSGWTQLCTSVACDISATTNTTLTSLPNLVLPGSQLSGNITGNAANITATTNATLTSLPSLSLPYSQLSSVPTPLAFSAPLSLSDSTVSIPASTSSVNGYLAGSDFKKFQTVYYHYPVDVAVVENDVVISTTDLITSQAPLKFIQATNGGQTYYPALYGIAKNVSGGFADIFMGFGSVVDGFSFGAFIGVDYYIDPANPGKLTYLPPSTGSSSNPIKVGRAMDATHLILMPVGNFVQGKGYLYTSDGSYDSTLAVGSNGQFLMSNSASTYGLAWTTFVATAPLSYTASTHTFAINLAVPGAIGATTPNTGAFTTLKSTSLTNATSGHIMFSATAPTIASGFGTSPSVPANNGTAAFTINVGTGGTASSGVVTMPAATTGWACTVTPNGAPQAAAVMYSAPTSTTSITITNYTAATGVALAWSASAVISVQCKGY